MFRTDIPLLKLNGLHSSQSKKAFTLTEILVVVGLIALLSALLLPALARTREKGRQATCTSNLRQIGLATQMYLSDHDNKRPHRFDRLYDGGYIKEPQICVCPNDVSGNFDGLVYESTRMLNDPTLPPESIAHTYTPSFTDADWVWEALLRWGPQSGLAVCQMHGVNISRSPNDGRPTYGDYEGTILRLQMDGAVVVRRVKWERHGMPGNQFPQARWWDFFCDDRAAFTTNPTN